MDRDRDTGEGRAPGDDLAAEFEALRPQLTRVAYGILGSIAEAEDTVRNPEKLRGLAEDPPLTSSQKWSDSERKCERHAEAEGSEGSEGAAARRGAGTG